MRSTRKSVTAALLVAIWQIVSAAVSAQIIDVTTTADLADPAPGDGVCATAMGCTLRAAIETANARGRRPDDRACPPAPTR